MEADARAGSAPIARTALGSCAIAAATALVYAPALRGTWFWDDPAEIVENKALHTLAGLRDIWFAPDTPDYYPLKTSLQWLQWHAWGDSVLGYHLTNIGLHLLGALLLWRVLGRLGVRLAWVGGLIFAIHPLAVESVAWISELKNVLSLPFMLLSFEAWIRFDEARSEPAGKWSRPFTVSLLWFAASLLSKGSVVMLPAVLLLYCWWKRGRVTRGDALAAAPFFGLSLLLGIVTLHFQESVAMKGIVVVQGGLLSRLAVAGMAVAFYAGKFAWPADLLPIYPRWAADPPEFFQFLPWAGIAAVAVFLVRWRALSRPENRLPRDIAFGLGFFFINLLPVLGFIPMSYLRISWVADHFTYMPMIGLIGLAAAGIGTVLDPGHYFKQEDREGREGSNNGGTLSVLPGLPVQIRISIALLLTIAIGALGVESRGHAAIFRSEKDAWTYTLSRNPDAWLAHNNISNIYLNEGREADALAEIDAALRIKPDFAEAHNNRGNILLKNGRAEEARREFEAAMRFRPDYAEAINGLGNYYLKTERAAEALALYRKAYGLKPDYTNCLDNEGAALEKLGRNDEAIAVYRRVIGDMPGFAGAHYNLGIALANAGRFPEAAAQYAEAVRLSPGLAEAENNLGNSLAAMNRPAEAIAHYERAIKANPGSFEAHNNLGNSFFNIRRFSEAIGQYREAIRLNPGYVPVRVTLAVTLKAVGREAEARAQLRDALRLDPDNAFIRASLGLPKAAPKKR